MKRKLLILFFLGISVWVTAQTMEVTGTITDNENGEPLPGVNVVIENTTTGVITNLEGVFNINVPSDGVLILSYVGYTTERVLVNGQSQINIALVPSFEELDELVVVGYGTMRKSDVTGALTRIQESETVAAQYRSIDALLQGRAAGVKVSQNAGNLGGAISVRIRGTNSLRGNNEPLYVIDGVIINSAAEDVANASSDANELQTDQNGLTGLNLRDIESVEILKDASATAIYGSRGANGVVLITTRSGSGLDGKTQLNIYGNYEIANLSKRVDVLDPIGWSKYQNEYDNLLGNNPQYHIDGNAIYPISYSDSVPVVGDIPYEQIDWQDRIYKPAHSYNAGFTLRGNQGKTDYYMSGSFNDSKGIVETTQMQRGDFRLNLNSQINQRLEVKTRASFMFLDGSFAQAGSRSGGNRSFTKQVLTYRPVVGFTDEDSEDLELEISNPDAFIQDFDDLSRELRANLSLELTFNIIEGLDYQFRAGTDYRSKNRNRWYGLETYKGQRENGYATYSNLSRYSYTIDNLLTFTRKIKKHRINATIGATYDGMNLNNSTYEVSNFPVTTLRSEAPQAGEIVLSPYTIGYRDEAIFSILGRVNYSYANRYIATASIRSDKSSKFQPGYQTGYFPSAAFAWRISQEDFLKNVDAIYNLKLRAGYGKVGNSGIQPYQTLFTYSTNYYVGSDGSTILGNSPSRIPNRLLTWETTQQYNAGIDIALFRGRLNGVIDVYQKETVDLLLEKPMPASTGFGQMTVNEGTLQNRGIEFTIDGVILDKNNTVLSIGANIAKNKGKVTALGLPLDYIYQNGEAIQREFYLGRNVSSGTYFKAPANIFMVGEEVGLFWGLESRGIVQQSDVDAGNLPTYKGIPMQAGDVLFIDHDGDGNISDADKTFIGNPNPDFTYGFNVNLSYKRFTVYALFEGAYGNDIVNGYNISMGYAEGRSNNVLAEAYEKAWRPDLASNDYPRVGYRDNNSFFSDREVEDGSYFRWNNLTLSYELPEIPYLASASINLSATNLFTLTSYSGFEPQVTSYLFDGTIMGVDWVGTPNVRTFMVGLNLSF